MKLNNLLTIMAMCAMLPMFSCGSDSNTETGNSDPAATGTEAGPAPVATDATAAPGGVTAPFGNAASSGTTPTPAPTTATPVAAGSVKHYVCPKNCKGSGGDAAGTCPVCGSAYVHNQAFHGATPPPAPGTATPNAAAPAPPAPSPAQNAAGVWHYTCAKGCAGGAGTAGKCAKCGGDLAHNAAYHQ